MLKHCHATTASDGGKRFRRNVSSNPNLDNTLSLNSSGGSNSFNSSFGSCDNSSHVENIIITDSRRSSYSSPGEPISFMSRTSSFSSLSLDIQGPKTAIKIFAKCLRSDIEYKTLSIGHQTTSKEVIWMLLSKYRMRHRDPNLFYLTMDISITRTGVPMQRTLVLEDDSRPAEMKSCHPWGECRFSLQMRKGGLVRIHDSVLMEESKYKCLLIAEHTTVEEVIKILFHCYGLDRIERVDRFCIYEQCQSQYYERKLHHTDRPAQVQSLWPNPSSFMFVLRRDNHVDLGSIDSDIEAMDISDSPRASKSCTPLSSSSSTSDSSESSVESIRRMPPKFFQRQHQRIYDSPNRILLHNNKHLKPMLASGMSTLPPKANFILRGPVTNAPPPPPTTTSSSGPGSSTTTSIHESGLPSPPVLRPKPTAQSLLLLTSVRSSMGSLSSGSRASSASLHDYENYFYI